MLTSFLILSHSPRKTSDIQQGHKNSQVPIELMYILLKIFKKVLGFHCFYYTLPYFNS